MGYYTHFSLSVELLTDGERGELVFGTKDIIAELRDSYTSAHDALDEDGDPDESCKWYECRTDLVEFSKRYPHVLFVLRGEGREAGDLWILYAHNGKGQLTKAKIVYPDFDPAELA